MATMATSHKQSVLTNSLVKPPLNPLTGLSSTLIERPMSPYRGIFIDDTDGCDNFDVKQNDVTQLLREYTTDEIAAHLRQLSDDEFYIKLQELKTEQKKALQECEKLYQEKIAMQKALTEPADCDLDELFYRNEIRPVMNEHVSDTETSLYLNDISANYGGNVKDLSTKPPVATSFSTKPLTSTLFGSRLFKERPSTAPARWKLERSHSLDEHEWLKTRTTLDDNFNCTERYSPDDMNEAMSKIDNMWETFSIEDYAPRERRHSFTSATKSKSVQNEKDNWRHRLTIPKPFKMTLREEKKDKKKTSAQIDLENKRLEKIKAEEAECQKVFKASPAPAHIYLPLYDEIMEKNELRRHYVKQCCQEMLKSQEKPFNFVKREEEKKKVKSNSARRPKVSEKVAKSVFKAKPVPDYLYDKSIEEKLLEEEEYRKIRIKMRAEELLQEASLPSNMEMRQRLKEQKLKEQKSKEKFSHQRKNKTRGIHRVPDYDALFHQFQKEMSQRKVEKEPTIPKPFLLSEKNARSVHEKCIEEMKKEQQTLKDIRSSLASSRRYSTGSWTSLDAIPYRTTTAADLRSSMNRSYIERLTQKEQEELEEEERHRRRGLRLKKAIKEKVAQSNSALSQRETVRDRLRKFKESDRIRQEEYQKELEEIKRRVDQRPMLFEEESKKNAKKLAEKKFADTLKNAGINEDLVNNYSSSSAVQKETGTGDYDSDSFENTATKTEEVSGSEEEYEDQRE